MAAIKPPMYSVAIMPIWVGSMMAFARSGQIRPYLFGMFLLSAILILAWANISNDVFDAETGVDEHKYHSLVNLTGRKTLVFWVGNGFLLAGLLGIVWITWIQKDLTVLFLILAACGMGYLYQGPPFRLGYQGLGELLCFIAFGPLAVSAAYYSQMQSWSWMTLPSAILLGLITSLILFCSHFHQIEDDRAVGKLSPVVRLGTARAAGLIPWICGSLFGMTILFMGLGWLPWAGLLCFVSLPWAYQLSQLLIHDHDQPQRIQDSKFIAVKVHFWFSLLLGAGYAIAGVMGA
ncbi:MAG: 2-carboxy-1,4-naphthoquinone phytyltransferase [Synechococcaceae cyanobacterium SM2_3_1]|nr:2-carboxy-1,4-naphthoquinone phytyltransferase [Synechococcaceae cyanobacterium SM2_3_1]